MTTAQEKAIARSADHENLVGELVEALEDAVWTIEGLSGRDNSCDESVDVSEYKALIAKAKAEAQQ